MADAGPRLDTGHQGVLHERAAAVISGVPAGEADFDTEFLDYVLAVGVVDSPEAFIRGLLKNNF